MSTVVSAVVLVTGALVFMGLLMIADRKYPCTCGRSVPPYFYARHYRGGVMLALALWFTFIVVVEVLGHSTVWAVLNSLWMVYQWRCWWKHESGKYKKRAAKLAGRVTFNSHGRLVTE